MHDTYIKFDGVNGESTIVKDAGGAFVWSIESDDFLEFETDTTLEGKPEREEIDDYTAEMLPDMAPPEREEIEDYMAEQLPDHAPVEDFTMNFIEIEAL